MKLYLVGIPWDSFRISHVEVFKTRKAALAFIEHSEASELYAKGTLNIQTIEV